MSWRLVLPKQQRCEQICEKASHACCGTRPVSWPERLHFIYVRCSNSISVPPFDSDAIDAMMIPDDPP